jgi:hypothetical protein
MRHDAVCETQGPTQHRLTILEPRVYDPQIPRVFCGYTQSKNAEVETATRKVDEKYRQTGGAGK